jgi:divalent metal cation (Fe/Co/Zn/Cd) transporter
MDNVDPHIITTAEATAARVPGVLHAHARARWTGRTLRLEVEGWVEKTTTVDTADAIGRAVAEQISHELPEVRSFTWSARAV